MTTIQAITPVTGSLHIPAVLHPFVFLLHPPHLFLCPRPEYGASRCFFPEARYLPWFLPLRSVFILIVSSCSGVAERTATDHLIGGRRDGRAEYGRGTVQLQLRSHTAHNPSAGGAKGVILA